MAKKNGSKYSIGYKKPPRHSQFKPGQSGNIKGRPKRTDAVADVLWKELRARVAIVKDGKRQKISMLEAIMKQHLNKAAGGDPKAAAIVFNLLNFHKLEDGDNISALVREFRAVNARGMEADQDRTLTADAGDATGDVKK